MTMKMFSEDTNFVAETNRDIFAIKISRYSDTDAQSPARIVSVNYFLSDDEVRDLQMLCECHLRNKGVNE